MPHEDICNDQHCLLVWMFHSQELNQKINIIHAKALKIAYKDLDSDFEELLQKDSARLLQNIPTEIKNSSSLSQFKSIITTLTDQNCESRLCKTYIPNLGFI